MFSLKKPLVSLTVFLIYLSVFIISGIAQGKPEQYDIIIRNTKIIDGTGNRAFYGDVAIKGERIAKIGRLTGTAVLEIDGTGFETSPGFIDPHSHADLTIMNYPNAENLVMQGITTFLGGNCGNTHAPRKGLTFDDWLSRVEKSGISINYAPLVGHHPVRSLVMGSDFKRTATREEIEKMAHLVEEAMQSGAFGFSTFLDPSVAEFAGIEELAALAKVAGKYEGKYYPHTRGIQLQWSSDDPDEYGYEIIHSPLENAFVGRYRGYIEAIEVSRRAQVPLHIAHFSNAFWVPQPQPDFLKEAISKASLTEIIDKARSEGVDVSFDVMPFSATISGATYIRNEFSSPRMAWVQRYGREKLTGQKFIDDLKKAELRREIRKIFESGRLKFGMLNTKVDPYWFNRFNILSCTNSEYVGKTIGEIAGRKKKDPLETVFDLIVEDPDVQWVQADDPRMNEQAITAFLQHPQGMPCTDVAAYSFDMPPSQTPPPIAYGLYPNYLSYFVRKKKILTLEEAIKKATSVPAMVIGLIDRGVLKIGAYADIIVFDYEKIRYPGDFLNPVQKPEGIKYVFVNGTIVCKDQKHTKAKPGKVLRHK